ncbi:MAG TPA: HDOD domain-containing protein [Methylomirabilota bacterium]|nr:HDOD domain-containing protein [Methylomirabilota bacterium]
MYERFIARQPIFDARLKVFAYELLFRSGPQNIFQPRKEASSSVIVDSSTLFDLQTLTGHSRAFINVDEPALLRGAAHLLPPQRVVIEILETVDPTPEVVQACADLCAAGYTLALDDFAGDPKWDPLLPYVKFLKVDFRASDPEKCREIARRFRSNGVQLVAEKVETQADMKRARSLGFAYFQGFFFCKPMMVEGRDIPGNKLTYFQLLKAISEPVLSYSQIEELLKHEPALVYKLLRYMNSPLVGLRVEIHGVREAIALLGDKEFRRWVSVVAVVAMSSDKPPEIIRTALTRGYFCEELSHLIGMSAESSDLFLMGLLSVTDALLDRPIESILAGIPVSEELRVALCGGSNRFRNVYDALLAYERADWSGLSSIAHHFPTVEEQVPICYLAAAGRAGEIVA